MAWLGGILLVELYPTHLLAPGASLLCLGVLRCSFRPGAASLVSGRPVDRFRLAGFKPVECTPNRPKEERLTFWIRGFYCVFGAQVSLDNCRSYEGNSPVTEAKTFKDTPRACCYPGCADFQASGGPLVDWSRPGGEALVHDAPTELADCFTTCFCIKTSQNSSKSSPLVLTFPTTTKSHFFHASGLCGQFEPQNQRPDHDPRTIAMVPEGPLANLLRLGRSEELAGCGWILVSWECRPCRKPKEMMEDLTNEIDLFKRIFCRVDI